MAKSQSLRRENTLNKMANYVLLVGSTIAIALILIGAVLFAIHSNETIPHQVGESVQMDLKSAIKFQGKAIINLGIFILMLTPFLRVITCVIGFSLLRWWRFTLVSLFVLGMLIISMYYSAQI